MAIHTSSPDEAVGQLVRLSHHAGIQSPAAWVSNVIDIVVQVAPLPSGSLIIESISEVAKAEGERINLVPIFVYDNDFCSTGAVPQFCEQEATRKRATELSLFIGQD